MHITVQAALNAVAGLQSIVEPIFTKFADSDGLLTTTGNFHQALVFVAKGTTMTGSLQQMVDANKRNHNLLKLLSSLIKLLKS